MTTKVITFGTFDLFHIGHLRILQRAKALGDELIVGVCTDEYSFERKNKYPINNQNQRYEILDALKCVNSVFFEEFDNKKFYIQKYKADIMAMGSDWENHFDYLQTYCKVQYLQRTSSISTTLIIEKIINEM